MTRHEEKHANNDSVKDDPKVGKGLHTWDTQVEYVPSPWFKASALELSTKLLKEEVWRREWQTTNSESPGESYT